jgi:pimeloyl-ACP methyl ester carboxylesterase
MAPATDPASAADPPATEDAAVGIPRRARLHATVIDHDPHRPKPRIAFCHGLFGQGKNWTAIAKQLADDYSVTLIDMPDHGRSPWTAELSYELLADLVADFLRSSDPGGDGRDSGWTLVGHSMGGKIAMTLALRHPELVRALAVVDIAPVDYAGLSEFGRYVQGMRAVDLTTLRTRSQADDQLRDAVPDPGVRSFLLQNLRRSSESTGDEEGWHWQMNLQLLGDHLDVLAGWPDQSSRSYPGPTLWLAGANSSYIKPEYAPAMRRMFPQVRLVKIKNASHWVHSDQPTVFTAVLRDFLRRTTDEVS